MADKGRRTEDGQPIVTLGENPTQLKQFRLEATAVGLHLQEPAADVVLLLIRQRTIVLFQLPFTEEGYARQTTASQTG